MNLIDYPYLFYLQQKRQNPKYTKQKKSHHTYLQQTKK